MNDFQQISFDFIEQTYDNQQSHSNGKNPNLCRQQRNTKIQQIDKLSEVNYQDVNKSCCHYLGQIYINKEKNVVVNQFYNLNEKMFTIKKYLIDKNEWENEINILKKLKDTDITLKLISYEQENNQYYFEQVCGLKDFFNLRQDFMPFILQGNQECLIYDKFISILFIRLIQKLNRLHELGYAHSDIKPSNIVIGYDFEPYFIDLGGAVSLDQPEEYLSQYTEKYNLPRYFQYDEQKGNQIYDFQNKEEVIFCEFTQLSITIIYMLLPYLQDVETLFKEKQYEKLISAHCSDFPQTKKILEIIFTTQLQSQSNQMKFKQLKKIEESIDINIDYEQLSKIFMKTCDIQYNSITHKFEINRINQKNINIINCIDTQFQNIEIQPNQVDIEPVKESPVFEKIVKKYKIIPFQNIKKHNYSFNINYNILNLNKWIQSSFSQNQIIEIEINSKGNMDTLIEGLQNASSYYNIRMNIKFIDQSLAKLFLQKIKEINYFQIGQFEINDINQFMLIISLTQINPAEIINQNKSIQQSQYLLEQKIQQQNAIILTDITIQKGKKINRQNSIEELQDNYENKINQILDSKSFINVYLKHYQSDSTSHRSLEYSLLRYIYNLDQPLNIHFKISSIRESDKNYQKIVEVALENFLKEYQSQNKNKKQFHKLAISIKYNLSYNFNDIFSKQFLQKDPIDIFQVLNFDQEINKDIIQQIGQTQLNSFMIEQNFQIKSIQHKYRNIKNKVLTSVSSQIMSSLEFLLNKNNLRYTFCKLTLQFNLLLITSEVYNIIKYCVDKYLLIDIIFTNCFYDLEILKSIMKLQNCSFEYQEKIVEKELKKKYSIKFNSHHQNEPRKQIKVLFVKSSKKNQIKSDEFIKEMIRTYSIDLEFQNDNIKMSDEIKMNDIINIFKFNDYNVQQILIKLQHLKVLKSQSQQLNINYQIDNQSFHSQQLQLNNKYQKNPYQMKNMLEGIKYMVNKISYEIIILNRDIKKVMNDYKYQKKIKQIKEQEQQRENIYQKYTYQFSKHILSILLQTNLFKQDRVTQYFSNDLSKLFQFLLLNHFSYIEISQDAFQMEFKIYGSNLSLLSFEIFVRRLSQIIQQNCVKSLNRLYIELNMSILSEEKISIKEEYDEISQDIMNIDLIIINFSNRSSKIQDYQQFSKFISNIKGNNVYIYLPQEHLYTLNILQEVICCKQQARKLLLDMKQNEDKNVIYFLLTWILQSKIKNKISFRIQTTKQQFQVIFEAFDQFFKSNNCQQLIYYIDDKNTLDELIIQYNGTIPSNDLDCDIQIKCYEKDIYFPNRKKLYDNSFNNKKNKNIQFNPVSITYEICNKAVLKAIKSYLFIEPLIIIEIEQDLQNFVSQNTEYYYQVKFKMQNDQFDYEQFQKQKKIEDQEVIENDIQTHNKISMNKSKKKDTLQKDGGNKKQQIEDKQNNDQSSINIKQNRIKIQQSNMTFIQKKCKQEDKIFIRNMDADFEEYQREQEIQNQIKNIDNSNKNISDLY